MGGPREGGGRNLKSPGGHGNVFLCGGEAACNMEHAVLLDASRDVPRIVSVGEGPLTRADVYADISQKKATPAQPKK